MTTREFDFATLPAADRYKLLIGLVVPRPIALVTTRNAGGGVNAAPFSFFNVFSHDPPILVLGIEQRPGLGAKDTVLNIRQRHEFVVNIVDEAIAEAMNVCAIDFPPGVDELAEAGLTAAPSVAIDVPRIAEAPAHLECRLMEEMRFGEDGKRSIVLGEIVHVGVRDDVVDERLRVDVAALDPIGRLAGAGYARMTDLFDMPRVSLEAWQARK